MFNTGNPTQDAISHINDLEKSPSLLAEQVSCDLCPSKCDLIDMIPAPDKGGYYCVDCFKIGDVESYLLRVAGNGMTKEEITNYINSIKI